MKKYLPVLLLLVLIVPSVALASWWNPLSWNIFSFLHKKEPIPQTQIEIQKTPEEKINELQKQLDELKNQKESSTPDTIPTVKEITKNISNVDNSEIIKKQVQAQLDIAIKAKAEQDALIAKQKIQEEPIAQPPTVIIPDEVNINPIRPLKSNGSLDYTAFNDLNVRDYTKNPKASLSKPVKIMNGIITAFNQGNQNYIEVVDLNDSSSVINFRIENDNNYTIATNELIKYDRVLIYGYGENNVKFNVVGNGGSYEQFQPVIEIDTLFKCSTKSLCAYTYNPGVSKIFEIK